MASSLLDQPQPGNNAPEFSVSELSALVKKTIEGAFGRVRVRGEISECKRHSSGHLYFTLKEGTSILAGVCWRGQVGHLALQPAVGMEVVCTGRLTTYGGQSKYQLVLEGIALAGLGALLKMLEERKKKLAAEGLFDPARKRPLPYLPRTIGVVTSPTGAVIRDIVHRLSERFPRPVLLWPVAVQGEGAAEQIAQAIRGFNALPDEDRPDLLIVARGGGSVEDLMPFNEECVVRATAESRIPIISAVGHETDTTLIDYASDLRAPTPTAAAEKAVPVRADLAAQVMDDGARLVQSVTRLLQSSRERLRLVEQAIGDPRRALEPLEQRLDERSERLDLSWRRLIEQRRFRLDEAAGRLRHPRDLLVLAAQRLTNIVQKGSFAFHALLTQKTHRFESIGAGLEHLSPRAVLGRGYTLVQDATGALVTSSRTIEGGDHLSLEFHDGTRSVTAD
ncbi:MAG: exodeoxyribonuclease VII large subunit [Alphaproteobacteria bacterium]|nr:exodeoxyribonuclease VII large subunit [Alphaproteobacteria bacterium]